METLQGEWDDVELAGHACACFEPAAPSPHPYVVIYLHDSSGESLAAREPLVAALVEHGLRAIAPRTGRSWWLNHPIDAFDSEISPEQFVVESVVPFVKEKWGAEPPRIALLGCGMGGQGAIRISYRHADMFPIFAAIAPSLDFQFRFRDGDPTLRSLYRDEENARQDTAILHVHPMNWTRNQWFCAPPEDYDRWTGADRLRMKLASIGIPFECDIETSAGASGDIGAESAYFQTMAPRAVKFIAERLERERLRIV